jgi:vacuolar-type H+-ATPase subunit F/Vma7
MRIVYLGDPLTAAGYRLAGLDVRVPAPGRETESLARAAEDAALVLVGAAVASRIEAAALRAAIVAVVPPTLVVPDLSDSPVPDVATRLRTLLGLEPAGTP